MTSRRPLLMLRAHPDGISLLELLVAMFVISLLLSLITMAVQRARESARRVQCTANLKTLATGVTEYEIINGHYPAYGSKTALLPFIDQNALAQAMADDLLKRRRAGESTNIDNSAYNDHVVPTFLCPSDSAREVQQGTAGTNYGWNCGVSEYRRGFVEGFFPEVVASTGRMEGFGDHGILDGLSQTAMFAEFLRSDGGDGRLRNAWSLQADKYEFPRDSVLYVDDCESLPVTPREHGYGSSSVRGIYWMQPSPIYSAYNHTLPPNRPTCKMTILTSSSAHAGGANVVFGDGHVEFVSENIDRAEWRELGSRGVLSSD